MFLYIILFSSVTTLVHSSNILVIVPLQSVSHHKWVEVLVGSLLDKGHNITLIGHEDAKIKSENYTTYKIPDFSDIFDDMDLVDHQHGTSIFTNLLSVWQFMSICSERNLKSNALKAILYYPRDKFDLIILDMFCGYEFYPLIEYFQNPPVVGISPFGLSPYILDAMGSHFYFHYPYYHVSYTDDMTFLQAIENTLSYWGEYFLKRFYMRRIYKMSQERYGENIMPFDKTERKIGILLANYDPILGIAQPLAPNIIPVGGLHVKRPEKLPIDLEDILNNAKGGIIYFSLGTITKPSWLSIETKKIFLNVFSKLNQTILWKYTANDLKDVPGNVIIKSWFPQSDLLAHKNVKLFITHGGALSSHEAMYHAVPVLGIPMFADQRVNTERMAAKRLGKKLHISYLNEDILLQTILEIINNPIYKQNIQETSRIFQDQMETPLERATFWIEYVLRNKDVSHLSTKAREMTLLQRENLDVYGVILLVILAIFVLFFVVIKYTLRGLIFKKKQKIKQN